MVPVAADGHCPRVHAHRSGKFVVNDKPVDEFFSRETGRMVRPQPLELTQHTNTFDILVNVEGRRVRQAGAVRTDTAP